MGVGWGVESKSKIVHCNITSAVSNEDTVPVRCSWDRGVLSGEYKQKEAKQLSIQDVATDTYYRKT